MMSSDSNFEDVFRASERRLREIFDNTSAVIYVKDLEGRYLMINRQFEQLFSVSRNEILGQTDIDVFPRELAEAFQENDRCVIETQTALKCEETAPHPDGLHTYVSIKFPLRDDRDRLYAVAGISTDITDLIRSERQLESLRDRMDLIINSVADGILEVNLEGRITFANLAAARILKRNPRQLEGMSEDQVWAARILDPDTGQPVNSNRVEPFECETTLVDRDGRIVPVAYSRAPLVESGECVGAVVSFRDLTMQHERRRYERQLQTAELVQGLLYPKTGPQLAGYDIAGAVVPAETISGDYYDYIPLPDGTIAIVVGDVSGHGLGPAMHMVEVRAYLRATLRSGEGLLPTILKLNSILGEDLPSGAFVSLFVLILDPGDGSLRYVAAGHDAWIMRNDGQRERLNSTGPILGLTDTPRMEERRAGKLAKGDRLLLATDGLAETINLSEQLYSIERALEWIENSNGLTALDTIHGLMEDARNFAEGRRQEDDVTLVMVQVPETGETD